MICGTTSSVRGLSLSISTLISLTGDRGQDSLQKATGLVVVGPAASALSNSICSGQKTHERALDLRFADLGAEVGSGSNVSIAPRTRQGL